jgi:hypothetical protein
LGDKFFRNAKLVMPAGKRQGTLRMDADMLDWFRTQGKGYQSRMNAVPGLCGGAAVGACGGQIATLLTGPQNQLDPNTDGLHITLATERVWRIGWEIITHL